jgi:single-strand DNA-binding protein
MNKVILIGRLTKAPEMKYLQNEANTAMARYSLAVDRRYKKDGETQTDFISCVTFGKNAEFATKYLKKGMKIAVSGRIQTGSYENSEGARIYTTDVLVEEHYFVESKKSSKPDTADQTDKDGFMQVPDGEELPFV